LPWLPFRSLGSDSTASHFAAGLQDELLTQLTKVGSLRVIGRNSVDEYGGSSKPVEEIARELGVGTVALGSVQVEGDRLRVIIRLVDANTRQDLWGEHYDRTLEDAFVVQSEIARQIVSALGTRLTPAEAGAIGDAPTANPEAYQLFLQGRDYHRRPGLLRQNLLVAERLYHEAIGFDSTFGPAHAALARVILDRYMAKYEFSPERLALGRREAEIAVRLSPGLPEARLAAGLVLSMEGRHEDALREFRAGLAIAPNHPDLWSGIGQVYARQGLWDSTIVAINNALQYDPRASNLLQKLGDTYHLLHRYPEAIAAYRRELVLAPDLVQPHLSLAWSYILASGQIDTLRAALTGVPLNADLGLGAGPVLVDRLTLATMEGKPDSVLALVRSAGLDVQSHWYRHPPRLPKARQDGGVPGHADSLDLLNERALRDHPEYSGLHETRGTIAALRGRRAVALRETRWLGEDAAATPQHVTNWRTGRARIFMLAGEMDSAIAELDSLLAGRHSRRWHYLPLDPWWEPITSGPRFSGVSGEVWRAMNRQIYGLCGELSPCYSASEQRCRNR
jgi:TolB-like protein